MNCGIARTGETSGTSETGERNEKAERAGTGETSGAGETSGSASRTGRDVGREGVFFCFCGLSFVVCNYFVSLSLENYN